MFPPRVQDHKYAAGSFHVPDVLAPQLVEMSKLAFLTNSGTLVPTSGGGCSSHSRLVGVELYSILRFITTSTSMKPDS